MSSPGKLFEGARSGRPRLSSEGTGEPTRARPLSSCGPKAGVPMEAGVPIVVVASPKREFMSSRRTPDVSG